MFPRRTLTRVQIGISAQVRRLRLASEIEVAKTDHRHSEKHRAKHEADSRLAPCLRVERAAPFENNVHDRLSETDVRLLHQLAFDRPTLTSEILKAALREEIVADNPPSIWNRVSSLRAINPYKGGRKPFVEDRLRSEWTRTMK